MYYNEEFFDAEVCGSENYELGKDFQALTLETGNPSQHPTYRLENTLDCSRSLEPLTQNEPYQTIWSVKFSPSGQSIASGGEGKVLLWNTAGELKGELFCGGNCSLVTQVDWSKDENLLVSAGKELLLWNFNGYVKRFREHESSVLSAKFSRDDGFILSGSEDGTAKICNTETGKCIETVLMSSDSAVTTGEFHPDGTRFMVTSYDGYCRMYDLNSMKVVEDFTDGRRCITAAKFSPDSRYILFSKRGFSLSLYDMRMQKVVGSYKKKFCRDILGPNFSFTASGKYIVSGSYDGVVYIWDVTTQRIVQVLEGKSGDVECVDCHPENDTILLSGDQENSVKIWKSQN